jgi:hypothetical protein
MAITAARNYTQSSSYVMANCFAFSAGVPSVEKALSRLLTGQFVARFFMKSASEP